MDSTRRDLTVSFSARRLFGHRNGFGSAAQNKGCSLKRCGFVVWYAVIGSFYTGVFTQSIVLLKAIKGFGEVFRIIEDNGTKLIGRSKVPSF